MACSVKKDGSALTIGDVKREIRRWFSELNVEDPDGVIFAIGRDAGVPHSSGEDSDVMALGKTIVYDIFPREPGGGYFFDFTRTWCLGFAPPEVEKTYRDVMDVFNTIMSRAKGERSMSHLPDAHLRAFRSEGPRHGSNRPQHGAGLRA